MFQRSLVLAIGLCLAGLPALCADERGDKLVGAWKSRTKVLGYDQLMTIANDNGQWSVKGTYEKDGAVAGSFVGENVHFAGGQLTYRSRYVKKPAGSWQEHDITLRVDGDALTMSWVARPAGKSVRVFERMSEPKPAPTTVANEPAKPRPSAKPQEKLVGTWQGGGGGRFDEYWTVTHDGAAFKVTGTYWKNGKQVGSCHGTGVFYGKDGLTFRRTFDKKPAATLSNDLPCTLKVTESGVELVVGNPKGKGEALKPAEEPKAVAANDSGKPTTPTPTPKGTRRPRAEGFDGIWAGTLPGTTHQLILIVRKRKDDWAAEGYLVSADNKRLAYFKQADAKTDAEGKSMAVTPKWLETGAPLSGEPALLLTPQPRRALRAEFSDPKMADKIAVDLTLSDPTVFDKLKLSEPKVEAPRTGDKTSTIEAFKLPPDTPAAKPFAALDTKQQVSALAVSPDGKRVAIGSRHLIADLGKTQADFTADLAVWDLEKQQQVWIKKKLVEEPGVAAVTTLAFSGDGKILAAQPRKGPFSVPVRFYSAETGQELKSMAPLDLKVNVTCLAFHPSKLQLVVGTGDSPAHGQLALIDLRTRKALWALNNVHHTAVDGLALSPGGEMIATFGRTADEKGYWKGAWGVKLFDTARGKLLHDFGAAAQGIPSSVIFSGDGKQLAALFGDLGKVSIVIWDTASHQEIRRITDLAGGSYSSRHNLAFLADNKTLAVPGWDKHLHLFDVTTGQRVGVYPRAYGLSASDVFAVGDGQMLLTHREAHTQGEELLLWKRSDALPPQKALGSAPK